jgi:uncharacterized protein (TIGR02611 family)
VEKFKAFLAKLPHPIRWVVVAMVGFTLVLLGIALIPTPAPGLLFIFFGLSILAIEIKWARELNQQGMQILQRTVARIKRIFKRNKDQ